MTTPAYAQFLDYKPDFAVNTGAQGIDWVRRNLLALKAMPVMGSMLGLSTDGADLSTPDNYYWQRSDFAAGQRQDRKLRSKNTWTDGSLVRQEFAWDLQVSAGGDGWVFFAYIDYIYTNGILATSTWYEGTV